MRGNIFNHCISCIRDVLRPHNEIATSTPLPDEDPQIDIKTLDKLWRLENGSLKIVPKNEMCFIDQLNKYDRNWIDANTHVSIMNVWDVIIYQAMTEKEKKDLKYLKRNPGAEIPQSLKKYEESTLKNLIELYGTPRMKKIKKALNITMDTYPEDKRLNYKSNQFEKPIHMK
ncbi:hypothetical protein RF11_01342 [Thelohanellus kitauei]|uniref:Uncharacterized protein n=1 Tax=Thelohanellus kitauei TaxID=669202 RepID=A0A0C2J1Q7_THEKT|nr:hypothetical protein RF11_01342 [Thelohanellus kitauei]